MKKKGFLVGDTLISWIIVVAVIVLGLTLAFLLTDKGKSAIDYFTNLLKFGI